MATCKYLILLIHDLAINPCFREYHKNAHFLNQSTNDFSYYHHYHLRIFCELDTHRRNGFKNSINSNKYMLVLLIFLVFNWSILTFKCSFITSWDYNAYVEWFISSMHDVPWTQIFACMIFLKLSLVWFVFMAKCKNECCIMFSFYQISRQEKRMF